MKHPAGPIFSACGGDVLERTVGGVRWLSAAAAADLHLFLVHELLNAAASGQREAERFYKARESELRLAMAARRDWRRAAAA